MTTHEQRTVLDPPDEVAMAVADEPRVEGEGCGRYVRDADSRC